MGNICRSPTAQGVLQKLINDDGFGQMILVDSAGTYANQVGMKTDSRAVSAAKKRGYKLSKYRARKVTEADFENFDYVLAMDNENHADLLSQCEEQFKRKVKLFLEFASTSDVLEVPDPYYGGLKGFEIVLDLVEDASKGLLEHIKQIHSLGSSAK